jgi:isoleucyl-tRNA synthetase
VRQLVEGNPVVVAGHEIGPDDVIVQRVPRQGMVVAADGPLTVAINTAVTPERAIEGTARELINRIQQIRRDKALDVADRISVSWSSRSPRVKAAFETHAGVIAAEVLAVAINEDDQIPGEAVEIEGETAMLLVIRADEPQGVSPSSSAQRGR